jgi:hypothetical protein
VAFKLNEVIPWGRSFEVWRRMFFLTRKDRAGRILGCGDGPRHNRPNKFPAEMAWGRGPGEQ